MSGFVNNIAVSCERHKVRLAFAAVTTVVLLTLWDQAGSLIEFGWFVVLTVFIAFSVYRLGRKDIENVLRLLGQKEKDAASKIVLGHSICSICDYLYDYVLYIPVIASFGLVKGFLILVIGSFVASWIEIKIYDRLGDDWLGWEAAKRADEVVFFRSYNPATLIGKVLFPLAAFAAKIFWWALKKSVFTAFVALSIAFDPFHTTIYLRKGINNYDGLSKRDWLIFSASSVFSNAYWSLRTVIIIWIAKALYQGFILFINAVNQYNL